MSTTTKLAELEHRMEDAREVAIALRVPDSDRMGPGREPVTVSGWYEVPTLSGRHAWQRYDWRDGQVVDGSCTYSIHAENSYRDAGFDWAEASSFARQDALRDS